MKPFWQGFMKRAEADPSTIGRWMSQAETEEARLEEDEKERRSDRHDDPRENAEWRGPDNWYRFWP